MDILDLRPWPERMLERLESPGSRLARGLAPLSSVYRAASVIHRAIVPRRPLPESPHSIAVGNLRVGGTGKTPMSAEIVRILSAEGLGCAILTRGYRSEGGGDEPSWLRSVSGVPVIVDGDRRRGFSAAREAGAEVVVLDDGFQSTHEARTRLCLILEEDLTVPPRVLPAGPAREPLSALERAHALLVRCRDDELPREPTALPETVRGLPRFGFRMRGRGLLDLEANAVGFESAVEWGPALLVSGLARPWSFERDALATGLAADSALRFSDHERFGEGAKARIGRALERSGAGWILTTEKNLRRLSASHPGVPVWALRSGLEWTAESPRDWLIERLRR